MIFNFNMESRIISSETSLSDSVFSVDLSSTIVVDSTSSSAKEDCCSASAPASVVSVNDSDVSEPAMAVLHTIVSSGDDGAEASDDSFVTQEHVEQGDASSNKLQILEAESVAAAVAVAAANARLRFFRTHRTFAQVSRRRRPGRQALLLDRQCDLSGSPPPKIFPTEGHWRPSLSLSLLFGARPSQRIERHSDSRRCARRGGRRNDATENVKNVVAPRTSSST